MKGAEGWGGEIRPVEKNNSLNVPTTKGQRGRNASQPSMFGIYEDELRRRGGQGNIFFFGVLDLPFH